MMAKLSQTWSMETFDAIHILVPETRFVIKGVDGDQVILEGDLDERTMGDFQLQVVDRWLQIRQLQRPRGTHFTLRVPKKKTWVIEHSAWRGEVHVEDLVARLQIKIGKGEIQVEHCQGMFDLVVGDGEVRVADCVETQVPEYPPEPQSEPSPKAEAPEAETTADAHSKSKSKTGWDWWTWDEQDWTEWGLQFAEQATTWANQFSRFFTHWDWKPWQVGMHFQTGKGDVQVERVDAESCAVWVGKGNATWENGRIADLETFVGHGDIRCEALMPRGVWTLKTTNGHVHLSLPADAQTKLDAATRHGDIRSDIPLVRVARPGPESRHGRRMVGTLGQPDGKPAEITLVAVNGDIRIELRPSAGAHPAKPATETRPVEASGMEENRNATAASPSAPQAKTETVQPNDAAPAFDSELAVLQALGEGRITVEQAEQLLRGVRA
jgi:Toastrack DUF4097